MSSEKNLDIQERPIGVFDSGLGGLTAVREITKVMPGENLVYFGDTGRVPYGSKSRAAIIRYAVQDMNFLKSMNVKMIVAACGTVSSVLRDAEHDILFTGVLEPTCLAAVRASRNKRIGVIGTSATIESGSYKSRIHSLDKDIFVYELACPLFAPMIESGFISKDNEIVQAAVKHYINPLKEFNIDTLILGCTHYPIISEAISEVIGKNVTLIDSGRETAQLVKQMLEDNNLLSARVSGGKRDFYVSDGIESFAYTAGIFLGGSIKGRVRKADASAFDGEDKKIK